MNKKISLHSHIGILNFSKYNIFEDGDLELVIDGNNITNSKIEVVVDNGTSQKRYACKTNVVVIDKSFIKVGILKIKVNILVNGMLARSYQCEDLIITDTKDEFVAIPEMQKLRDETKAVSNKMDEVLDKFSILEDLVSRLYGINVKVGDKDE
jgi:hypothetical protein